MRRHILIMALAITAYGCGGQVSIKESGQQPYVYSGAKYGRVTVEAGPKIRDDSDKSFRVQQLDLANTIAMQLRSQQLFDAEGGGEIHVVVNDIRVRNAFNAVMFGFMSGSDNVNGNVTLRTPDGQEVSQFDVSAQYALGGYAGGQDQMRLGWLSKKFAEMTIDTIVQKPTGKTKRKSKASDQS